jgi:hypothetical protein
LAVFLGKRNDFRFAANTVVGGKIDQERFVEIGRGRTYFISTPRNIERMTRLAA